MSQNSSTQIFAVADPRSFDGNPYEVAERAARQVEALAALTRQAAEQAKLMIRNADLERQLALDGECSVEAYDASALARKVDQALEDFKRIQKDFSVVATAVAFNPKSKVGR